MDIKQFLTTITITLLLTKSVVAGVINHNDSVSFGNLLTTQTSPIDGSFDINSLLKSYQENDVEIISAYLNFSGYSAAKPIQRNIGRESSLVKSTPRFVTYREYKSVRAWVQSGHFINTSVVEEYKCGFLKSSTCTKIVYGKQWVDTSKYVYGYEYVNSTRGVTDREYEHTYTTEKNDLVQDKMTVNIGGDVHSASTTERIVDSKLTSTSSSTSGSYNYGRTTTTRLDYLKRDLSFGAINLNIDINELVKETIAAGKSTLDWSAMATRGQFNFNNASLNLNYNETQRQTVSTEPATAQVDSISVPEPSTIFLIASGLGFGLLNRRKVYKSRN